VTRPIEYAQILLQCLGEALDAGPNPIAPEHVCLRFGEEVRPSLGTQTDECCTGLAWTRVAGVSGLLEADDPTNNGVCANTARRLELELGTARCIPFGTTQAPPTCAQWTEAALKMDADHHAMEQALCCFREAIEDLPFAPQSITVGEYEPRGPDGLCISGTLLVTLDYDCGCGSA
jgi:hypothetical protein